MLSFFNPYLLVFLMASLNWFLTFLGATVVVFVKKDCRKLISIALGVASGIMIAASFFSLLLPAKEAINPNNKLGLLIIPLGFIVGVLFLRVFDMILPHEHMMSHNQEGIGVSNFSKNKLLFLAMTLHNIPEGLAVGVAFAGCSDNVLPAMILSIGIGIQNFPEGTAISLPMHQSGMSKFKAIMYGQFSALVEIPSAMIGFIFASLIESLLPFALSFAAGAMMFVCIEELIPEANATKEVDVGTISFMIGFIIMMTLDIILG